MESSPSAVRVANVDKEFRTRSGEVVRALAAISLSVAPGQFACIVGPSGSGKSTLLRIIGGLASPTAGTAEIGGVPVTEPRPEAAFVFQRPLLLDWMTVTNNVLMPARISRGRRLDEATRERAQRLLELVGIGDFADVLPRQLSGGMQQRAAIARALLLDPSLLLLDEPFGSLDALTREQLHLELLRIWSARLERSGDSAAKPKTILMVTHDIAEAAFLSDVVFVMSKRPGRILARIEVDLPRPRELSLTVTPDFADIVTRIRAALAPDETPLDHIELAEPAVEEVAR